MAKSSKPGKPESGADVVPMRPPRKCPICGKAATRQYYPFDSKRCADIDLARWLGGGYAIAGEPVNIPERSEDDE